MKVEGKMLKNLTKYKLKTSMLPHYLKTCINYLQISSEYCQDLAITTRPAQLSQDPASYLQTSVQISTLRTQCSLHLELIAN